MAPFKAPSTRLRVRFKTHTFCYVYASIQTETEKLENAAEPRFVFKLRGIAGENDDADARVWLPD